MILSSSLATSVTPACLCGGCQPSSCPLQICYCVIYPVTCCLRTIKKMGLLLMDYVKFHQEDQGVANVLRIYQEPVLPLLAPPLQRGDSSQCDWSNPFPHSVCALTGRPLQFEYLNRSLSGCDGSGCSAGAGWGLFYRRGGEWQPGPPGGAIGQITEAADSPPG
ncbi:hypothetical protein NDU88_003573 [Pleurodeles waltl]|uniref:Uncharacterized protein n=1 Tax=Pleurodeles waltl TaxID=8319 RepID=A0AAV7TP28_PLEWA|nr:hypothetical protein NDU88_003573 [Pleurodeles waltl]